MLTRPLSLQTHIQTHTLGVRWWESQKAAIIDEKEELTYQMHLDLQRKEKADIKAREVVSDEMVRQRMGDMKYFLTPWRRGAEKAHLLRIVAIESDLDNAYHRISMRR